MIKGFYKTKEYREKQSLITKRNWENGVFDFFYKKDKRKCLRESCGVIFEVVPSDKKNYCSRSCGAIINNSKRGPMSDTQKLKISKTLQGRKYDGFKNPLKGKIKVARVEIVCVNPKCKKIFLIERWMKRKYCSNQCHMTVMGGRPTSPKASKGKAGIRKDISKTIYFRSRWEANYARFLNYINVKWIYEPKTFNLKTQNYTPDFYLPEKDIYIEIKNFLWKYSKIRDEKFRNLYPNVRLKLFLKKDYLKLQDTYAKLIKNWEYKNSSLNS